MSDMSCTTVPKMYLVYASVFLTLISGGVGLYLAINALVEEEAGSGSGEAGSGTA